MCEPINPQNTKFRWIFKFTKSTSVEGLDNQTSEMRNNLAEKATLIAYFLTHRFPISLFFTTREREPIL